MICPLALEPFFLKDFHVRADIGCHGADTFQDDPSQDILPDVMGGTGSPAAFISGADVAVLAAFSILAGGKMEPAAAVGTVHKS